MIEPLHMQTSAGLSAPNNAEKMGVWWCPSCSLLVKQEKNPVLCDECDGDMTIAPEKYWKSLRRSGEK